MTKDLLKEISKNELFTENETVVIALSGGVDSMVLFDILRNIESNLKLVIAHVNHKQRKESEAEYTKIKALADKLRIPFEGYSLNMEVKRNFHDESRNQRYDFFKVVAQKHNSKKIVLAHHKDDQVETILMRIVRGSSFTGYAGIPYVRREGNISFIRPLIKYSKEDIIDYAKANSIEYYEDMSNKDPKYTRNRYRNTVIPMLKKENPNIDDKIIQLQDYIQSADIVLEKLKVDFLKTYCLHNTVDLDSFNTLDNILKIKVLKHMINIGTSDSVEVSYEQYNNIIEVCLNDSANKRISLDKSYSFYKEYDHAYVSKPPVHKEINIDVNSFKEYFIDDNKSIIFSDKKLEQNYSNYIELCYNKLVFPVKLRNRKNGDKIALKSGTKKIKDLLIDLKIPLSERDNIVIVAKDDEILGIPSLKKVVHRENCEKKIFIYEVN